MEDKQIFFLISKDTGKVIMTANAPVLLKKRHNEMANTAIIQMNIDIFVAWVAAGHMEV